MFAKGYQFRIPINPRNLSQMIHPHQGYMVSMPERGFSWEEMVQMYELQVVSSNEKAKGRTLHAEELSALSFWLIADTEQEGHLSDVRRMKQLMHGLHFTDVDTWYDFRREFKFSIEQGEVR